ncbi:MAG: hypothetical protein LBM96_01965 [Methanobrevibacter sp.]|jgi:hypothetical protein|nr:hypothetical protein [Candidatus Methanoflexus mossambicus]
MEEKNKILKVLTLFMLIVLRRFLISKGSASSDTNIRSTTDGVIDGAYIPIRQSKFLFT